MNIYREIIAWIESEGSFLTGFDLYIRAGGGAEERSLRTYSQQGFITESQERELIDALNLKLEDSGYDLKQPTPAKVETVDEPDSVVALRQQLRILKKREASLHGQMKALAFQPEPHIHKDQLHDLAREMMYTIQPSLDEVWSQLNLWNNEGVLPVPGRDRIIRETLEKVKRLKSMTQRISQLRSKLKAKDLPADKRESHEQEIQAKQTAILQLNEELDV